VIFRKAATSAFTLPDSLSACYLPYSSPSQPFSIADYHIMKNNAIIITNPFLYLTPLIPLSFKGEGEEILERGLSPPLFLTLPFPFQGALPKSHSESTSGV
jgi:hypothetical protein